VYNNLKSPEAGVMTTYLTSRPSHDTLDSINDLKTNVLSLLVTIQPQYQIVRTICLENNTFKINIIFNDLTLNNFFYSFENKNIKN